MLLFVDETENEQYFIVVGLLVNSEESINLAYKRFKNSINHYPLPNKTRSKLYSEFKSVLLDRNYHKIKEQLLLEVLKTNGTVYYSLYEKKTKNFNQSLKEKIYLRLLNRMVAGIQYDNVEIIFDKFGINDFENKIVQEISKYAIISKIHPEDSQIYSGLQFVDNIASVIRLHLSNMDEHQYYRIVETMIIQI